DDCAGADLTLQSLAREVGGKNIGVMRINNKKIYQQFYGQGHIMGATRMGGDASLSVVDRNARVHELQNLYIAGCSIFPNAGGPAPPTMNLMALAHRLAEHLAAGIRGG
ncbi:MAG: GMC family oxidoreductase, partial [Gammaproteobacteria bacterium]